MLFSTRTASLKGVMNASKWGADIQLTRAEISLRIVTLFVFMAGHLITYLEKEVVSAFMLVLLLFIVIIIIITLVRNMHAL